MLRIWIEWDFISPSMGAVSGIATVHYVEGVNNWTQIAKFRVKCEPGMLGYSSEKEGIPTLLMDAIKPRLDQMLRSFRDGIALEKITFTWVHQDECEKSKLSLSEIEEKYKNSDKIFKIVEDGDYSISPI